MFELPHVPYMNAVAHALAGRDIPPGEQHVEVRDGQLVANFRWPAGTANAAAWPDGVTLTWSPQLGWRLLVLSERGGCSWPLSPDADTYAQPFQVAADVEARLATGMGGATPGPICILTSLWDAPATEAAVTAWVSARSTTSA